MSFIKKTKWEDTESEQDQAVLFAERLRERITMLAPEESLPEEARANPYRAVCEAACLILQKQNFGKDLPNIADLHQKTRAFLRCEEGLKSFIGVYQTPDESEKTDCDRHLFPGYLMQDDKRMQDVFAIADFPQQIEALRALFAHALSDATPSGTPGKRSSSIFLPAQIAQLRDAQQMLEEIHTQTIDQADFSERFAAFNAFVAKEYAQHRQTEESGQSTPSPGSSIAPIGLKVHLPTSPASARQFA